MGKLKDIPRTWAGDVEVNPTDLATTTRTEVLNVVLSFETGEQGIHLVYVPYACKVTGWRVFVTKALAATDAGTVTIKNSAGTNMTPNAVATLAASAPYGTEANQVGTNTNNTVGAGSNFQLVTAKTTAGGKLQAQVTIERT